MGVSGSGKTTVGELVAKRLGVEYADADDFHSAANRQKLHAGIPLTDQDREPWLRAIGQWLADHKHDGGVVSCSALKRRYRDLLRMRAPNLILLFCDGSKELITERIAARSHHFMSPALLECQFAELERPGADEPCFADDMTAPPDVIVSRFITDVVRREVREE
jgi:gluconokinase